jgi:hypothetical protein
LPAGAGVADTVGLVALLNLAAIGVDL